MERPDSVDKILEYGDRLSGKGSLASDEVNEAVLFSETFWHFDGVDVYQVNQDFVPELYAKTEEGFGYSLMVEDPEMYEMLQRKDDEAIARERLQHLGKLRNDRRRPGGV